MQSLERLFLISVFLNIIFSDSRFSLSKHLNELYSIGTFNTDSHHYMSLIRYRCNISISKLSCDYRRGFSLTACNLNSFKFDLKNILNYTDDNIETPSDQHTTAHGQTNTQPYDGIFQNSEFQFLRLSEYGSLMQPSDNQLGNSNIQLPGFHGEEELSDTALNNSINRNHALALNPNETGLIRRLRSNERRRSVEELNNSWMNFQINVIGNEKSIECFHFTLPKFPENLNKETFKMYLYAVNSIDYTYDTKGYHRQIYFQMKEIKDNLNKFEGLLDIEIMHEFIKFFGNYREQIQIVKILKKFEVLGVLPTKDTLDLIINKLNVLSPKQRKFWLQLYLQMGISEWKVVLDILTRARVCMIMEPSSDRLSIWKAILNEGLDYNIIKWYYVEDCLRIEISRNKFDFNKVFDKLLTKKLVTVEDKLETYQKYIGLLTANKQSIIAINHVINNPELETSDCWTVIIETLVKDNKIWEAFAVYNHARDCKIDLHKLTASLLRQRKKVFIAFTKLKDPKGASIFVSVYKYLISECLGDDVDYLGDLNEQINESFDTIRLDTKGMSNFTQRSKNQMVLPVLLAEIKAGKLHELQMDRSELPWK